MLLIFFPLDAVVPFGPLNSWSVVCLFVLFVDANTDTQRNAT